MTPLNNPSNDFEDCPLELITTRIHGHIHPGARWGTAERGACAAVATTWSRGRLVRPGREGDCGRDNDVCLPHRRGPAWLQCCTPQPQPQPQRRYCATQGGGPPPPAASLARRPGRRGAEKILRDPEWAGKAA